MPILSVTFWSVDHGSQKKARPFQPTAHQQIPVAGVLLGVAGLGILAVSVVMFVASRFHQDQMAPPVVIVNPPEPDPIITPTPPPIVEAWWDGVPDSTLGATVAQLKVVLPRERALFDRLSSKSDIARLDAYQKLLAQLPELIRDQQFKMLLGRLLIDCYALEPAERNAEPLRDWFVAQIPQENAKYPPGYKSDDLDRSFWALDVSMEALTHKAIRLDRAKHLSQDLGKAFGFAIDPSTPRVELKARAEKLLALRCYRNLVPTAAKSAEEALAIRETLIKKVPQYLSPSFREAIDIELAFVTFPAAKTCWGPYSSLLRDCLSVEGGTTDLEIVELYKQADPELAAKMEPLLAGKWKAAEDKTLNQAAKVKAMQKALGVPDPTDRLTQLEKLARETLASANSPITKSNAVLQETARLSHASTLACALMQKEMGQARFDQLVARIPEIDQGEQKPLEVKKDPDDPVGKTPPAKPLVVGAAPLIVKDQLALTSEKDPVRKGCFRKVHVVAFKRGRTYTIDMVSEFDNYLRLESANGTRLREDDDSGGGLNARIVFNATADGNYRGIATTNRAGDTGPYTLIIQEQSGFGGPGFGPPGFGPPPFGPPGFFPRRLFPPPFGRFPPPGMFPPPPPPVVIPNKPPVNPDQPDPPASLVDEADLVNLEKNVEKIRITALQNITSKLNGDLTQKDFTPHQALKIAKYLVTVQKKTELDEIVTKLIPIAKSRNLMLALADQVEQDNAVQKTSEAVLGALLDQPLQFSKDENWRLACRKMLLVQALEFTGKKKDAAAETAEVLRNQYQEQGLLLGIPAADLQPLTRPSQVLESLIKHLAAKLSKQTPGKAEKEYLDQVPRHLLVAQFVAENDLERTVMLQRVWIKVLAMHLQQQSPDRAKAMGQVQDELAEQDRLSASALAQLRGGEEKLLRLWALALDMK